MSSRYTYGMTDTNRTVGKVFIGEPLPRPAIIPERNDSALIADLVRIVERNNKIIEQYENASSPAR